MEETAKLRKFENAVFAEVDQMVSQMKREAEEYKSKIIKENEDKALVLSYDKLQKDTQEIRKGYRRDIASYVLKTKHEVLEKRNELTSMMFNNISARLNAFCASSEYDKYLTDAVAEFAKAQTLSECVIGLLPRDMRLAEAVKKAYGSPCEVETDNNIRIGGFVVRDAKDGYYFDETLFEKLRGERTEFIKSGKFALSDGR